MKKLSPEKKKARKEAMLKRMINALNRRGDTAMSTGREIRAIKYYEMADRLDARLVDSQIYY